MVTIELDGSKWQIETVHGSKYTVSIRTVSDHKGLAFSGTFRYNGVNYGVGCFPLNEIRKIVRIED